MLALRRPWLPTSLKLPGWVRLVCSENPAAFPDFIGARASIHLSGNPFRLPAPAPISVATHLGSLTSERKPRWSAVLEAWNTGLVQPHEYCMKHVIWTRPCVVLCLALRFAKIIKS